MSVRDDQSVHTRIYACLATDIGSEEALGILFGSAMIRAGVGEEGWEGGKGDHDLQTRV